MRSAIACPGEKTQVAWYAVKTRARHEKRVVRTLVERGIDCFVPLARRRHRWSDRVQLVELPLFPTYVFVHIALGQRGTVLTAHGVVGILGAGARPTPVPDAEIDTVLQLVFRDALLEPHPYVAAGERVRIRSGPFAGIEGTIVRTCGKTRVVVAIDLIRQAVALTIDPADVEPA